jgi:hypothetical protein
MAQLKNSMDNTANMGGGGGNLAFISILGAFISITDVQPVLTFIGSLIAIISGLISIYKKTKK